MNSKRATGKANEIAGSVMRKVGKATGSKKMQVKGALRQTEGKVQGAVGKIQEKMSKPASRAGASRTSSAKGKTIEVKTTRVTTIKKR
jgi:uncharacterized protein YjbJ (UPF0337 family)